MIAEQMGTEQAISETIEQWSAYKGVKTLERARSYCQVAMGGTQRTRG